MDRTRTQAAYAAHIGKNTTYVSKLKRQGRLVLKKNKAGRDEVDFDKSDRLRLATADLARAGNGANAKTTSREPATEPAYDEERGHAAFRKAQILEKVFTAKTVEMEFNQLAGDLVERKRVQDAAYTVGRMVRDSVLAVPARLAPELAGISDSWEIEKRLTAAIRQALDDVGKISETDMERAMES